MKYICSLCKNIVEDISDPIFRCPKCGIDKSAYKIYYEIENVSKKVVITKSNPSINRIDETCIDCGMCRKTCNSITGLNFDRNKPECVNCGNCILTCPTGCLTPKYNYNEVKNLLNKDKVVISFVAPAVRTSFGESFGLDAGSNLTGKIVSALRELGFNYVLDTTFGADITVTEESKELLDRVTSRKNSPMFTSCCPAWVKFVLTKYPKFIPNLSSTKSPNSIMGALIKSYFAERKKIDAKDIVTVGIVPCTAKKYEKDRPELSNDGFNNVDFMLTTTELVMMIKESNVSMDSLSDSDFDSLMGKGSTSGLIFGSSGGVMEASLRTLAHRLNVKNSDLNILNIRSTDSIKEFDINIGNLNLKVAVVYGLSNASKLLKEIESGEKKFDFVEVMACPCGCVGGAGNPLQNINKFPLIREQRLNGLSKIDEKSNIKNPYQNKEVQKLYNSFLTKDKVHSLLHTSFNEKKSES